MNPHAVSRRTLLIGAATLAGCASTGPVALDRQALASVRRVAVPTPGIPAQPTVEVVNGVPGQLGVLGLIAGDAAHNRRVEVLGNLLDAQGLHASDTLQRALLDRLRARGFGPVPQSADPARQAFLSADPADPAHDATLDVYITRYGFVALSEASNEPYRPTVGLAVRLTRASDAAVLLRDAITISDVAGAPTFGSFVGIENDPARAAASLRQAFATAADRVVQRLT